MSSPQINQSIRVNDTSQGEIVRESTVQDDRLDQVFKPHLLPYNISQYPRVRELPLELLPFSQKVRRVNIAQKRNLKEFYRSKVADYKHMHMRKGKILAEGMRNDPAYVNPNAINEKKVILWSQKLHSNLKSKSM